MEKIYENLKLNTLKYWSQFAGHRLTFNFEGNFDSGYHLMWFRTNWFHSIYYSMTYAILVYLGVKLMKTREPYILRTPLALWSTSLALFSILGTVRCLPEFIEVITYKGIVESFCSISYADDNRILFWHLLFGWSKVIEFGDTLFIILRKQKLINLHWIHHITTVIGCYSGLADLCGAQRWTVVMNFLVHSLMYSYFALRAMRYKIPAIVSKLITSLQILQMTSGLIIMLVISSFKLTNSRPHCVNNTSQILLGLVVYSIFLVMFINFFVKSYFKPTEKSNYADENNNKKFS